MNSMNAICDFFLSSVDPRDAEARRQGRLLVVCTLPLFGLVLISLLIGILGQPDPLHMVTVVVMALVVGGELVALRVGGRVQLLCWLHVFVLHMIAATAIDTPGSSSEAAVLFTATIPAISIFLLGRWGGLSLLTASVLIGTLVLTGLEPLLQAVVSMGFITLVCMAYEDNRESSAALAEEKNQALGKALGQAQSAANAKDQFLATISHEIRTPMNGVLGMNRLLLETELDEEQEELARMAMASGDHLMVLVNDVLDFARLQAARISLEQIPFEIGPLLQELKFHHMAGIVNQGLGFEVLVGPGVPVWVKGDRKRIFQILSQLLDNASKFTFEGGITVRVESHEGGLSLAVEDSGIGIRESQQAVIFDAFSQVDGSPARLFGGTGLGLAISEHLVRQMGGAIELSSTEGQGSIFRVELPGIGCLEPVEGVGEVSLDAVLRILVVEDNVINQMLARRLLERMGHSVHISPDGAAGVERVKTGDYDLIFMDCQMPVMDGYAATAEIRTLGLKSKVPIIALTANAMEGDRERCVQAGMDDYLSKPVSPAELEDVIRRWQTA